MEKVWHGLQFNPVAPVEVPFKAELFHPAPMSVRVLRRLSRKGRDYLEHTTRMLEGKPKLVLGLPNDAQEVAQLVALAHSDTSRKLSPAPNDGQSDLDPVGSTTTMSPSTEPWVSDGIHRQVRSDVEAANQGASQRSVVPGRANSTAIDAGPTRRPQVGSFATPFAEAGYDDDFVPETTLTRLDEMLSEDQRRIVEDQAMEALLRLTRPVHRRPVAAVSKSDHLIKELKESLRDADEIDQPGRVAQEDHKHAVSEETEHRHQSSTRLHL